MVGILSGIVKGQAANRDYALQQQRLSLAERGQQTAEQQQQFQQQQVQRQNERQDLHDQIDASSEELGSMVNGAAPARAVLQDPRAQLPTGAKPVTGPEADAWQKQNDAATAYRNSDIYKQAEQHMKDVAPKFQEATGRHLGLIGKLSKNYAGEVADDTKLAPYLLNTYGIGAVSPRQYLHYRIGADGLPPEGFLRGPNNEPSQYEQAAQKLVNGVQSNNLDGLDKEASLLLPELHLGLGQQMDNGHTVTGAQATHMMLDPKDPNYVLISHAVRTEGPDGSTRYLQSPHGDPNGLRIPVSDMMNRLKNFTGSVQEMSDPEAQAKLREGLQNGDSALHNFLQTAGEAGIPPPAPIAVKRGESLLDPVTKKPIYEAPQYKPANVQLFEKTRADVAASHPDWSEEDIDDETQRIDRQSRPNAGLGNGAAGGGAAPVKEPKLTDSLRKSAVSDAIDGVAESYGFHKAPTGENKGQWVDAQGKVATDPDFHSALHKINANALKARTQKDLETLDPDAGKHNPPAAIHAYPNGVTVEFRNGKWVRTK